jgi:hypothetical protein
MQFIDKLLVSLSLVVTVINLHLISMAKQKRTGARIANSELILQPPSSSLYIIRILLQPQLNYDSVALRKTEDLKAIEELREKYS